MEEKGRRERVEGRFLRGFPKKNSGERMGRRGGRGSKQRQANKKLGMQ